MYSSRAKLSHRVRLLASDFKDIPLVLFSAVKRTASILFIQFLCRDWGIPSDAGVPVQYEGSTTGPSYNEVGSPLQVS
ncbi:MAG TPA: hypothetical protein EYP76_03025, partial [Thiomicrorhabdus sp.]|nr:hypothetical protein [Thiomicrorhabdus sp.]